MALKDFIPGNTSLHPDKHTGSDFLAAEVNAVRDAIYDLKDHTSGYINVKDSGAKGDGVAGSPSVGTDDTAALSAAFAAGSAFGHVLLPAGVYRVTSQITINRPYGMIVEGAGRQATIIQWDGPAGQDVFRIFNGRHSTFRNFTIYGKTSARPIALIRSLGDVTDPLMLAGPTAMTFQNIQLGSPAANDHDYAITYSWQNQDAANDQGRFIDLYINNSRLANVYLDGVNSKFNEFHHCQLFGGQFGVKTNSASFTLRGGFNASHTDTDFDVNTPQDMVLIEGTGSEASRRFFVDHGPTSNTHAISLIGNSFASNGMTSSEPVVLIQTLGPATITGNKFGASSLGFAPKIQLDFAGPGTANVSYNTWDFQGSYEVASGLVVTPQIGPNIVRQEGNLYRDVSGVVHALPTPSVYTGNTSFTSNVAISGALVAPGATSAGSVVAGSVAVGQNLLANSGNVATQASGWLLLQAGGLVTTPNAGLNDLGSSGAALWKINSTSSLVHGIRQAYTYIAQQYTLSAKARAGTYGYLALDMNTGGNQSAVFNLNTGVVAFSDAGVTAAVAAVPNGYRCSITRTQSAGAGSPEIYFNGSAVANSRTYAGSLSDTMYVWDAQLEVGALGQYVATGAAASPGTFTAPYGHVGTVSPDRGDTSQTLTVNVDNIEQRWDTALTANRTVTLSTTGATNGDCFRVVRTGLGAFTLDVGGLKTIPSATAAAVDVSFNGTAWKLSGYGLL